MSFAANYEENDANDFINDNRSPEAGATAVTRRRPHRTKLTDHLGTYQIEDTTLLLSGYLDISQKIRAYFNHSERECFAEHTDSQPSETIDAWEHETDMSTDDRESLNTSKKQTPYIELAAVLSFLMTHLFRKYLVTRYTTSLSCSKA